LPFANGALCGFAVNIDFFSESHIKSLDTRYPKMLKKSNSSIVEFKNSGAEELDVLIIKEERRVKFGNSSIGNQTGEAK
jgi:hypothetical protein